MYLKTHSETMKSSKHFFSLLCLLFFATTAPAVEIVRDQNSPESAKTKPIKLADGDSLRIEDGFELTTDDTAVTTEGDNHQIKNAGKIETKNDSAYAIHSKGNYAIIINSGTLTTAGGTYMGEPTAAHGIYSAGDYARITNSGILTTKGQRSDGIYSEGDHAIITNSGELTVNDEITAGIDSTGDHATITNSGTLKVTGGNSNGIVSGGAKDQIINSGILTTDGEHAYGIRAEGAAARITNSYRLETKGVNAHGITTSAESNDAIITNSGTLTTVDKEARGILSFGTATITNSGTLTTQGQSAYGIEVEDDTTITNSGTLTTKGVDAHGIYASTNVTITNSGTISVADMTKGYAIFAIDGSTGLTLNIEPGSRIIGRIDLGDAKRGVKTTDDMRDTVNINGASYRLVIEKAEIVNQNVEGFMQVQKDGTTTTITLVRPPTTATAGRALSALSSALQGVSRQRLDHNRALGLTLSNARHFQARAPLLWGQVFGGSEQVDGKDKALAYDLTQQGFSIGYERDYRGRRLGLFGGVATSNSESAVQSFAQETSSTYFGAYAHFNLGDFNLATALIAGTDRHDSERLFVGSNLKGAKTETAKADFNGWFLSPSVSLSSVYDLNDQVELRPSIRLDYSLANRDKYTESGSTTDANLAVNSRSLSAFTAQLQVAAVYHLNPGMDLTAHLGFGNRRFSEDDMKVSLGSESIEYVPAGESSSSGLIAGLGLRTSLNDRFNLAAGVALEGEHLGYQFNLEYGF